MWVVSELVFQMTFAGVIRIRHDGSKESIDAVRRQTLIKVPCTAFRETKWFGVNFEVSKQTPQRTAFNGEVGHPLRGSLKGQGELVLGVAVRKDNSAHLHLTLITRLFVHQEKCPAALQLAKSLLSSRRRLCSASLDGVRLPASSLEIPMDSTLP